MAQLIDGKAISAQIKEEVKEKVAALKEQGCEVTLAVIQVGADPASSVYVRNKKKHVNTWVFVLWRMNFRRRPQKKSFWS